MLSLLLGLVSCVWGVLSVRTFTRNVGLGDGVTNDGDDEDKAKEMAPSDYEALNHHVIVEAFGADDGTIITTLVRTTHSHTPCSVSYLLRTGDDQTCICCSDCGDLII